MVLVEAFREVLLDDEEIQRTIAQLTIWKVKYLIYHPVRSGQRQNDSSIFSAPRQEEGLTVYQDEMVIVIRPEV